jgi:hypothetical protein
MNQSARQRKPACSEKVQPFHALRKQDPPPLFNSILANLML